MNAPTLPFDLAAVGQPLRRKEDIRLLTGQGRFSDDFSLPGQAYAAMVRSPHPHARIVSVDKAEALSMPGVLAVLTGADAAAEGLGPIPHSPLPKTKFDMKLFGPGGDPDPFIGPHVLLPADKARHVGEAVAMVIAATLEQAHDAAEMVAVEWEELPWVSKTLKALEPGAPAVWDEVPDNAFIDTWFGDPQATQRAFANADHVVRMSIDIPRVTAVTMEPRAALGHYDTQADRYTLYAGSGGAVRQKAELAEVLGIARSGLRVLSYDVGGNFGSRNRAYVEFGLVLWGSKKVGRPVKYTATRSEAFLSDYQGRDLATTVELAIAKDGRFLGMRADNVSNVGARAVSLSPLGKGAGLITGTYDIPAATLRARAVFTNTMPTNAYRSSGRPEVNFAIERLIDKAAHDLGFDRAELRRKNFVPPEVMPYMNAVGAEYDSGTYAANMELAMRVADWEGFPARKADAERRGLRAGIGLAPYVESSIGSPNERTDITVHPEGRVGVVIGTQPSGQGHETSFAQVAADVLGLPFEKVDIIIGDTDIVSVGGGSHSGRSMRHAATVITRAVGELIGKAKENAAVLLDTSADNIDWGDGRLSTPGSNKTFDLLELAAESAARGLPNLYVRTDNEMHDPVFPNGCAICEVEIDPDTGWIDITRYSTVDDVGRCINPLIVHGQTHGGIAQGVGQAMWELCAIDQDSGQPVAGSLMDYGMPRSDNIPSFATEIVEVLSPTNPFGIKAGGEGGTTPALSSVVNAVLDALWDLGVTDIAMPVTPYRIWQAIQDAKAATEGKQG
ncbi:MAG: xanthine dehydrogenase family protein molybdopterin-binding subunit [Hyphomicrobiaceae bacterium]